MKEKPKKITQLYRGRFNYRHEVHILYCYATTERGAWSRFCHRLADKHLVEPRFVMGIFDGKSNNYKIEKEIKNV